MARNPIKMSIFICKKHKSPVLHLKALKLSRIAVFLSNFPSQILQRRTS